MLSKKELLMGKLEASIPLMTPKDRQVARSLLTHYLRNHDLTGPQWRLAQVLADEATWQQADLEIAAEAEKHI